MNDIKPIYFAAGLVLFLFAGCAETGRYERLEQVCVSGTNKTQAMQKAEDVLVEMHFTIQKADAEHGYIRTKPLSGAQFFEFWRTDNVGSYNTTEANLHSIRRTAELNVAQKADKLCIDCDVKVQRLFLPEHEVSSSARAYQMFSENTAAMQTLRLHPQQKEQMAWLDLGSDTSLRTVILERIQERIAEPRKEEKP